MSSNDFAIRVEGLSKCYQIYDSPRDRLKQFLLPRFQKFVGKKGKQYYREFWALNDVSFEIRRGQTLGIIGRNGSGKSTLLQILCGTLSPTSGKVEINGRVAALLELGTGFNPEFSGRENIYLNASVLGLSRAEIDERFDDIVAFSEIGEFIEQPVKTYSSGMYVRLAFAVIAHVDADILIIDEALAVGDAFFVQKCFRFLRKFMETGTVLFVSHDTGAVISLCESAIWLHEGRKKYQEAPKKVAEKYLQALYESQQGASASIAASVENKPFVSSPQFRDMRLDFINGTQYRNDIELFKFNPNSDNFGKGGAIIELVQLLDTHARPLTWVVGGEDVQLAVQCKAYVTLISPIIGFFLKDRLGQSLFGDNTYITYSRNPLCIEQGRSFIVRFDFKMPILPIGDYSITVAIAEGTQQEHIQHHWIQDAILLKSHSSSATSGLIGIPMRSIEITAL